MRQPFDAMPFRQVRVPAWVQETIGCGYTLSGMDSKARAAAAAHGVTISEMGFVDPFYPYYDSKLLKRRSPHVPAGSARARHRRVQEAGRPHPGRLSALPPGRGLREPSRLAADRDQHHRDPPDRHEEVSARRDALPARALRRLLHRRPGRDPHEVSRTSTPSASTGCITAASATAATAGTTTARTPAPRSPDGHERPGLPPLPALGRPPHGRPGPADADAAQGDQARGRARDLDDQRRPVRPLPVDPPEHARADEPLARCARPGVLARRDQPRHDDRPGFRQRLHLGDDQPPHRLQRAVHPQPRQSLRQGQLPAAGDPPPDAAHADLRRRAQHRRGPAAQPAAGALRLPRRGQTAQALAHPQEARAVGGAGHERQHAATSTARSPGWSRSGTWPTSSAPSARRSRSICR